jgi:limonene-1,2-epoxide hydrolase
VRFIVLLAGVPGRRTGNVRTVFFSDVGIGVFEVTDGKITVWRAYFDLATLMKEWPQG